MNVCSPNTIKLHVTIYTHPLTDVNLSVLPDDNNDVTPEAVVCSNVGLYRYIDINTLCPKKDMITKSRDP